MSDEIKFRVKYGGVDLSCDEKVVSRLWDYIRAEPAVAKAVSGVDEGQTVTFIRIGPQVSEIPTEKLHWAHILAIGFVNITMAIVMIAGVLTISQWVQRRFF